MFSLNENINYDLALLDFERVMKFEPLSIEENDSEVYTLSEDFDLNIEKENQNSDTLGFSSLVTYNKMFISNTKGFKGINETFKRLQNEILSAETIKLTNILEREEIEFGFESESEKYFNELYDKVGIIADNVLSNIYLNEIGNNKILKSILYIISGLNKERTDNLAMIPLVAIGNSDIEVKELGVRCFESWDNPKYINVLKEIDVNIGWLKEYINDVIHDLEEQKEEQKGE